MHLESNSIKDCILSSDGDSAKFKILDANLHVPVVTLSTKDNVSLTKQLSDWFKRSVYQNSYQTIPAKGTNQGTNIYELLIASFQGVKRLFALAYVIAADDAHKLLTDGRNCYDQAIDDLIKHYDEARRVSTGQSGEYNTGSLLDYACFKNNYRLISVDLSKQKAFNADPRAIQLVVFQGVVEGADVAKIRLYTILKK